MRLCLCFLRWQLCRSARPFCLPRAPFFQLPREGFCQLASERKMAMASRLFVPSDPTESGGSVWRRYLLQPTGWLPLLIGAILLVVVNVQGYSLQWNWWVLLMTTFAVGLPLLPLHFSITRWSEFLVMRSKPLARLRLPLVSANRVAFTSPGW
jgi:hypothetical protein